MQTEPYLRGGANKPNVKRRHFLEPRTVPPMSQPQKGPVVLITQVPHCSITQFPAGSSEVPSACSSE